MPPRCIASRNGDSRLTFFERRQFETGTAEENLLITLRSTRAGSGLEVWHHELSAWVRETSAAVPASADTLAPPTKMSATVRNGRWRDLGRSELLPPRAELPHNLTFQPAGHTCRIVSYHG